MTTLILIAHGSRRTESNLEIEALSRRLAERVGARYASVGHAFLELASPSIPEAIDAAVRAGSDKVVLLPYFLASGNHVAHDIPALVADKQAEHPRVYFELKAYIGAHPAMLELLTAAV